MTKELTIKDYSIEKVKDMTSMAAVLKSHVVKHKLYTEIKGKNYAHVEGWQFAGGMLGLYPRVVSIESLSSGNEVKWRAEVEIVNQKTQQVISSGFAVCSNKENKKASFDEYAILSMAQTRAIGKAYRNMLGWVMKLAGYEGTPSEEMQKVGEETKGPSEPVVQKIPQEKLEDHVCSKCGTDLTKAEAEFSKKRFGKELCRGHQKEAKAKK